MVPIAWMLSIFLISCAPKQIWSSEPETARVQTAHVNVDFQPLKQDNQFYSSFRLAVRNLSDHPIHIDWNRTKYIHNGQKRGRFAFVGINPEDVRNGTVPEDTIYAGQSLSRQIGPLGFVAFSSYREGSTSIGNSRLSFGILPEGESGIELVLRSRNGLLQKTLSVRLAAEAESR